MCFGPPVLQMAWPYLPMSSAYPDLRVGERSQWHVVPYRFHSPSNIGAAQGINAQIIMSLLIGLDYWYTIFLTMNKCKSIRWKRGRVLWNQRNPTCLRQPSCLQINEMKWDQLGCQAVTVLLPSRDTSGQTAFITDCCAHQNDMRPNLLPLTSELQRPAAATNQWTETGTGITAHGCGDI